MPVTLPLDQMTLHEKLTVMKLTWDDLVWDDLARSPEGVESLA